MKIKKEKKPKTIKTLSQLKKEADKVFSRWIRSRDGHRCFTCMTSLDPSKSQNGHYISRTYLSLRYSEKNCHTQDYRCNVLLHGNLTVYAIRLINEYGTDVLHELEGLKRQKINSTREFLENVINKYKNA